MSFDICIFNKRTEILVSDVERMSVVIGNTGQKNIRTNFGFKAFISFPGIKY